jgi:galactokinase
VSDSPTPRARTGELTDVTDRDPTEDVLAPRTRVLQAFRDRFGEPATWLVRAPGRVNLIGEHTDYNDGFVLPMAIDRAVWIAARPRTDRTVALHSLDFGDAATIDLDAEPEHRRGSWAEYVIGMRWALARAGVVLTGGWEGTMAGNVPVGAGLSSSAALELAVARTLAAASDVAWDPPRMAVAAQAAENGWVGVNSGIMDQMISAAAREGHALLLDCRSLDGRHVPMPPDVVAVVLDTATRRGLVESAYNERRAQCEAAARAFGVPALRDVDEAAFAARADALDETTRRRARHVVTENARTVQAADALARGDAAEVGRLMDASHASLRDDFEVSRAELDAIVEIARAEPGCHGARMTGAGFGGCAVALVAREAAPALAAAVMRRYRAQVGLDAKAYVCVPSPGAGLEPV